jgi:flagellar basal-body rod modification protein FlgD
MPLGISATTAQSGARLDSLGLDLQSFLRIVLTQLSYQDPLKPVDNFEFVSQLGQFASLEQNRQLSERVDSLLTLQASTQALGLLGKTVDFATASGNLSGVVSNLSFSGASPVMTITAGNGQVYSGIALTAITQVR